MYFLVSFKAHHLHTFYVLWLEQKCLIMRSIKCCVWWKTHCTIQFVIHHCFIVVSFGWVIAATRKIKLSMNITQNHGFAIRVWTMVWHRTFVKINISCLFPIKIYLNICIIPRHLVVSNIGFLSFASIFHELLTENIKWCYFASIKEVVPSWIPFLSAILKDQLWLEHQCILT